jgi:hypothetical protein
LGLLEEGEEHKQEDPVKKEEEEPIDDGEEDPVKKQEAEKCNNSEFVIHFLLNKVQKFGPR